MNLKEMCKSLRLAYIAEIYEAIPMESSETFLLTLFEMEMRLREEAKAERLIKKQNSSIINHLRTIAGMTTSTSLVILRKKN